MGTRIGLLGSPNTGKSFGRSFLNGEECFAVLPSTKEPYLYKQGTYPDNPQLVDKLEFYTDKNPDTKSVASHKSIGWSEKSGVAPEMAIIRRMLANPALGKAIKCRGNYFVSPHMLDIPIISDFLQLFRPEIKILILADFTHFLTNITGTDKFQNTAGYGKFAKLAIESLNVFFTTAIDKMPDDMFVVTEFHLEERDDKEPGIFVPSGQMLKNHFKPESYFDILLGSKWISPEEDPLLGKSERYVYLTERTEEFQYVRDLGMFDTATIPNNLQLVVDRIRERKSK